MIVPIHLPLEFPVWKTEKKTQLKLIRGALSIGFSRNRTTFCRKLCRQMENIKVDDFVSIGN